MYAEFAPDRSRNERGVGSKVSDRVAKCTRARNVVPEIVPVVRPVGEVESLRYYLHVQPFADFYVLGQLGVELEERIPAKRIKSGNRAVIRQIVTILRAGIVSSESEQVFRIAFGHDNRGKGPTPGVKSVVRKAIPRIVGTGRAVLKDGREFKSLR